MKNVIRVLFLLLVLAIVPSVFGQFRSGDQSQNIDYYGGCDSSMTVEECYDSPMATYSSCTATGSSGCAACGNEQYTGLPVCVYNIHYDGSCQCHRGSDQYGNPFCRGSGKCTYRP